MKKVITVGPVTDYGIARDKFGFRGTEEDWFNLITGNAVGGGLPAIGPESEGCFLRIMNGSPVWYSIEDAEGVGF